MEEFTGQLGERAIGVTNLMAKTLNVTTKELFDMMQKGKLKPEDMFKLSDAMRNFAESSAGYEAALNNSTSAQMRMKNAWQLFAYTVLESGLDEALVAVFVGLSEIVKIATPAIKYLIAAARTFVLIAKGVIAAAKAIVWLAAEFKVFTTVILVWFLRKWAFTALAMAADWLAATILVMEQTHAVALAMQRLQAVMKGFVAVFMLTAMIEVWRQVDLYMKGEDNWIAVFIGYAMIGIGYIDVMIAKFEYLWAVIKNAPRVGLKGIAESYNDTFGNPELKKNPNLTFYDYDNATQHEAQLRWRQQHWYRSMMSAPEFTPQRMISELGMGSGNTLNVVIRTSDGKTYTQPVDLRSGTPVTIDLGGAANK